MKVLILALVTLMSLAAFSDSDKGRKDDKKELRGYPKPLSVFDVIPLNSPVKESNAKFLLKVPKGFDIDEVRYKVRNASRFFEKDQPHQKINLVDGLQGKELHISVSKLPPGFYQLFVKVKDQKRKEHEYKNKYKDHVMFVVNESLQVAMPNPKINNATLLGVDSDNDGIRDDVQRWINENFNSKPLDLKLALRQYAIDMQSVLSSSSNKVDSVKVTTAAIKSLICFVRVGAELNIPSLDKKELIQKVELMYTNTKIRIESKLKADENFHGQEITSLSKEEACNF